MDNKAMFKIGYGLYVLTANADKDNGCIINTAMQVTTTPNRIAVTVNKNNKTHDMIIESGKFNISIISIVFCFVSPLNIADPATIIFAPAFKTSSTLCV